MAYRVVQIHFPNAKNEEFSTILQDEIILDSWLIENDQKRMTYSLLVNTNHLQYITDKLHSFMGIGDKDGLIGVDRSDEPRLIVLPVEAILPKPDKGPDTKSKNIFSGISRDELYNNISKGASIDRTFILLVFFSTIVAAIGLLTNNVAVIIGAMVIAPMLSPNLALALSTALGDKTLMIKALKANAVGLGLIFLLSTILGAVWPENNLLETNEIMSRTHVGLDGIILALVSGAAGVVSLTTGVSGVLVGVMVAVALLPPATTFGLMLGSGHHYEAIGALLLLAVNIVCVNLAAKLTFLLQGVSPRTWYEKKKAQKVMKWYLAFWGIALLLLFVLMRLHNVMQG